MKRTLTLKREPIAELTTDEMTTVVGGGAPTLPVGECLQKFVDTLEATRCLCP